EREVDPVRVQVDFNLQPLAQRAAEREAHRAIRAVSFGRSVAVDQRLIQLVVFLDLAVEEPELPRFEESARVFRRWSGISKGSHPGRFLLLLPDALELLF